MSRTILPVIMLFLALLPAAAQEESEYICHDWLQVERPADSPLDFQALSFDSTLAGSGGAVTLVSRTDKAIAYYVVIMEFLDSRGKYLFSVPVFNVDDENHQEIPLSVPFKLWLRGNWPGGHMAPISAKSKSRETYGTVLTMLTCPVSVRVSLVQVRYGDGTEFKYSSPSLNISTIPVFGKIEEADYKRWSPLTVSGTLEVDSDGDVQILDLDVPGDMLKGWLRTQFSLWHFTIPWVDGKPSSAKLAFLVMIGDASKGRTQMEAMKKKGIRGPILLWPNLTSGSP